MKLGEFIARNGTPLVREAGEHVFRQGDQNRSLYFVKVGFLKAYYLSTDGKENIKSFISKGDSITSLMASYAGKPSTFSLVCLKSCELIVLPFSSLHEASRTNSDIAASIVDFLLNFAMKKEAREYELLCLSAEERYKKLLEDTPEIISLVTQNEIARYLGITPVGLSRIKKRVTGSPAARNS